MKKLVFLAVIAAALAACDQKPKDIRVTNQSAVAKVQATSRSEPIYYNGVTYQFDLKPLGNGQFDLKVSPMTAGQQKDAIAVGTSSLGYYACAEGKRGVLVGNPAFSGRTWKMTAICS